jgi:hypothetical protein
VPYFECPALLDIEPFKPQCRSELTYYFKVFNHLTPFEPKNVFLIYLPVASSDSPYLQKPVKASKKLLYTTFYRNVEAWSALPVSLRSLSSVQAFRSGLENVDLSSFLNDSSILMFLF